MSLLDLHVHEDIKEAAKYYNIPLSLYNKNDIYIMQGNRIVFIGKKTITVKWIENNKDKYCKSFY